MGLCATLAIVVIASAALVALSAGSSADAKPVGRSTSTRTASATTTSTTSTTVAPVAVLPARVFATGNEQLDALLTTLPQVLFEGGAQVHAGYNPIDCCHAGGYNPEPNEVWVGDTAFARSSSPFPSSFGVAPPGPFSRLKRRKRCGRVPCRPWPPCRGKENPK
jgi:hypothetical protein